jgi:YbgC/YbaW family acyl-CoA thioester hydrolase
MEEPSVELRFRDVDAFGHVYHAEYLTLLDELRTRWFDRVLRLRGPSDYVVAHVELDYVSSLVLEDRTVTGRFAVERVGTTSLTLRETLLADGSREVARSRTVVVLRDPATGSSRPLEAGERARAEGLVVPGA